MSEIPPDVKKLLDDAAAMIGNMIVSWSLTPEKEELVAWTHEYERLFPPPEFTGEPF